MTLEERLRDFAKFLGAGRGLAFRDGDPVHIEARLARYLLDRGLDIEHGTWCCVVGCENRGVHEREFNIKATWFGEIGTTAWFCCDHLDHLTLDRSPALELSVAGRIV